MAATASEFADFLEPKLSDIWHDPFPEQPSNWEQVFNVMDMNKNTITSAELAGFGGLQAQADGAEITFDDPISPRTKSFTYSVNGLAYRVHERLWRYDLYGEVERFEDDLRDSSRDDVEQSAWDVFNNSFGTTNTGFDGLALISTAHTRLDGGANQRNAPSTDEALSLSALHSAVIQIRKWKNHRGRPRAFTPDKVVVPPDLMMTLYEILDTTGKPGTANNDTNVLRGRFNLAPLVSDYLTSTTAWWIVCDNHDLRFYWAFRPETGMRVDWKTESIERKIRQGHTQGFASWYGVYGTDGVA